MVVHKSARADLRSRYPVIFELSLVLSLGLIIGLFTMPMQREATYEVILDQQEVVQVEEIEQTRHEQPPPPPPKPVAPIEVADDVVIEDEIELDISMDFGEVANVPPPPPPPPSAPEPEPEPEPEEAEIFVVVEDPPELIGGINAVQSRIKYPPIALQAGIEGMVVVQFVVDEQGNVQNPVVLRGIGGGCDEEAVRAVQDVKFKPGRQRGKPVKVRFSLPVRFRLE